MNAILIALASTVVLSGNGVVAGRLVGVIDPRTLQIQTARGLVELRVLGMDCPKPPRRKCRGAGKKACQSLLAVTEAAKERARRLLEPYDLNIIPCGNEFETDGHGRTLGAVQVSEDRDYLSKMVDEGWCSRLATACARE